MKIYSTRHGETAYNKEGRVLGVTDLPLNETGITQAAGLAEHIAELGDVDCMCNLGILYYEGKGVEKDVNKAVELYRQAAERGDDEANAELTKLKEQGVI